MRINWFPGHMNKARREIGKAMPKVSLIIEVLDARIPYSSANPLVPGLRGDKPFIKVLNKSDLADPAITAAWIKKLEEDPGVRAIALHKDEKKKIKGLLDLGRTLLPKDRSKDKPVTAMILGIPNVGKSTLINILANRILAKTGNEPAVTKRQQNIRLADKFYLMDTPGFLWPRLYPEACGYRLAVTGAIKDKVIAYEDIAFFAAEYLLKTYPDAIQTRYKLDELPAEVTPLMDAIAARRGCLARGGVTDLQKVCELFIRELRQGSMGLISLETPAEIRKQRSKEERE
jgi:ribosome biogenesis GTPase A